MTLKQWSDNGWLRPHTTTPEEVEDLFQIVNRYLKDARSGISADWRFGIAYNATLKLCAILLYAEGYKAERNLQHYRTIQALPKYWDQKKMMIQIIWIPVERSEIRRNTTQWVSLRTAIQMNLLSSLRALKMKSWHI